MSESNHSTPVLPATPTIIQDQLRNFARTSSFTPNPNGIHRELDPTRNLPQAPVSSIPPGAPDCPICTNPYDSPPPNSETPLTLPCGHIFGRTCLRSWIEENRVRWSRPTCPLCRAAIPIAPSPHPRNPQHARPFERNWHTIHMRMLIQCPPEFAALDPEARRQAEDTFLTNFMAAFQADLTALRQRGIENGGAVPSFVATDPVYAHMEESNRRVFERCVREIVVRDLEITRSDSSTRPMGVYELQVGPRPRRPDAQDTRSSSLTALLRVSAQPREQASREPALQNPVNIHRGTVAPGPRFGLSQGPSSSRLQQDAQQASRELSLPAVSYTNPETMAPNPRTAPSSSLRNILESRQAQPPPGQPTSGAGSSTWWSNIDQTINQAWETRNSSSRSSGPPDTTRSSSPRSIFSTQAPSPEQAEISTVMEQLRQEIENGREAARMVRETDRRVWEAEREVVGARAAVRRAERDVQQAREALEEYDREMMRESSGDGDVVRRRQFGPDN